MFYRLALPFGDVKEVDVEQLTIPSALALYLGAISLNINYPVFTSNFSRVTEAGKKWYSFAVTGAKGCGKTFTVLVLLILHRIKDKRCLFNSINI